MKTYSVQKMQSVNNRTTIKSSDKFTNCLDATALLLTSTCYKNEFFVICERGIDYIKRIY
jgi:hypothetical protein